MEALLAEARACLIARGRLTATGHGERVVLQAHLQLLGAEPRREDVDAHRLVGASDVDQREAARRHRAEIGRSAAGAIPSNSWRTHSMPWARAGSRPLRSPNMSNTSFSFNSQMTERGRAARG